MLSSDLRILKSCSSNFQSTNPQVWLIFSLQEKTRGAPLNTFPTVFMQILTEAHFLCETNMPPFQVRTLSSTEVNICVQPP